MITYLDLTSLLDLAEQILGQPPVVRDVGLLSSAAARPATVAFGAEAYEDLWSKAAALLHSLAGNHALLDGDKRLAWVAMRVFFDLNGVPPVPVDVGKAKAFVIAVVTHELDAAARSAESRLVLSATNRRRSGPSACRYGRRRRRRAGARQEQRRRTPPSQIWAGAWFQ